MIPFYIATPQGCDIQTFYGDASNTATKCRATWIKPVGVSHVYMLLIGGGGNGTGTSGGGSGGTTVFYCAAQHVPNSLFIWVGGAQTNSYVTVNSAGTASYLYANGASAATAGLAIANPAIAASGFYNSVAGQDGSTGTIGASATTFLGGGGTGSTNTGNYGYVTGLNGLFQMQPIIVGVGARSSGRGSVGCGGGVTAAQPGGPGMVLIASW